MKRRGFTLVEILVVIAIISVLIALLVPAVQKVREGASRTQTHMQMMQLVLAVQSANELHGQMPPATGWYGALAAPTEKTPGGVPATIYVHLLPFLGQDNLYAALLNSKFRMPQPPEAGAGAGPGGGGAAAANDWMGTVAVQGLVASMDHTTRSMSAGTSYAANLRVFSDLGLDTSWESAIQPSKSGRNPKTGLPWYYGSASLPDSIPDGLATTIAFATHYSECGPGTNAFFNSAGQEVNSPFFAFYAPKKPAFPAVNLGGGAANHLIFQLVPNMPDCDPKYTPQAFSTSGINVALLDGSVHVVGPRVSPRTWGFLVQPNDGMVLPADWH